MLEGGQVTKSNAESCHTIMIVDDDLIEAPEDLEAALRPVFNVAEVDLSPDLATITIVDTDCKNSSKFHYFIPVKCHYYLTSSL